MVTTRKKIAAPVIGERLNLLLLMMPPTRRISDNPTMETSAVSFCSATKSLSRGQDPSYRLGHHDVAQRLPLRETERARGRSLAPVDALEPRPIHLGDVCPVDEREREHAEPEQLRVAAQVGGEGLDPGEREAEADEVDHDDRRDAAEHVGVHDRERAQREEGSSGQLAHDRHDERPNEHDHLGDEEQLDVPQKP